MAQSTNALPQPYTTRPEPDKGMVAVGRPGFANVSVPQEAAGAVAQVLGALTPDGQRLEPGAVLRVADPFTGRSVDVPASLMESVGAVIARLATKNVPSAPVKKEASKDRPTYSAEIAPAGDVDTVPAGMDMKAAKKAAGKARSGVAVKAESKPTVKAGRKAAMKTERPDGVPTEREGPEIPSIQPSTTTVKRRVTTASKTKAKKKMKKAPRILGALPPAAKERGADGLPPKPAGFDSAVEEVNAGIPGIRIRAEPTPLAMKSPLERIVDKRAQGGEETIRWGFEVFDPQGKHLAWIIALGEKKLLITGMRGDTPEENRRRDPQRLMVGVLSRIDVNL